MDTEMDDALLTPLGVILGGGGGGGGGEEQQGVGGWKTACQLFETSAGVLKGGGARGDKVVTVTV